MVSTLVPELCAPINVESRTRPFCAVAGGLEGRPPGGGGGGGGGPEKVSMISSLITGSATNLRRRPAWAEEAAVVEEEGEAWLRFGVWRSVSGESALTRGIKRALRWYYSITNGCRRLKHTIDTENEARQSVDVAAFECSFLATVDAQQPRMSPLT